MSKPDRNTEEGQTGAGDDGRDELKKLFDAIGEQLSDADRRHAAAVDEMQSRVSDLAHETEALREHMPEPFSETFGRIEKGVADLAKRLAGQNEETTDEHFAPEPAAARVPEPPRFSLGFSGAEPDVSNVERRLDADAPSGAHAMWLEDRFSDIAKGIEHALAEIKPDSGWNRIGERFDHLEQHITNALEGVAMRSDLGAVRLIEAHVGEVVNHLAETHQHLMRLDVIEKQLSTMSQMLGLTPGGPEGADIYHVANSNEARLDIEAIARAAAEQTAQRVSDMAASKGADGLRPLIDQMISESRAGRENTAMHLDTLQEAMIRVLDRIEAMEIGNPAAPQVAEAPPANLFNHQDTLVERNPPTLLSEISAPMFGGGDTLQFGPDEPRVGLAPVEQADVSESAAIAYDPTEQRRRDFIAEARRAKLRLAASDDEIVITAPGASGAYAAASGQRGQGAEPATPRPIRRTAAAAPAKSSGPSAPSPLLIIVAVAVLLMLGGLWFMLGGRSSNPSADLAPAHSDTDSSGARSDSSGAADTHATDAVAPDRRSELPAENGDAITPTRTGARTTLPMLGVAVDLDNPVTKSSLQRSERHQAMAAMSGQLGAHAATGSDAVVVPASMVPSAAEVEGAGKAIATVEPTRNGPLDLPAATVGPLSLRLAAANGDPSAQFEVGSRFAEGKGTTQSFKDAAKWYQRAADQGFAPAQYRL